MKELRYLMIGLSLLIGSDFAYAQNQYPSSGKALVNGLDIGEERNTSSAQYGLNIGYTSYTNFQLAYDTWSGSHAILFNAYHPTPNPTGSLAGYGNTSFANNVGPYNGGAGSIMFFGNGGTMDFYISPASIGKDSLVNWGVPKMRIKRNGAVGIGTTTPDEKLTVAGTVKSREVIVEENTGADFVFEEDYDLPDLSELETFIKTNKHLPEIPTAEQMKEEGVKVGGLQMKLLQKIEELTLYAIEQQKTIDQGRETEEIQNELIEILLDQNKQLFKRIEQLESKKGSL